MTWTAARDRLERRPPSAWNRARDQAEYAFWCARLAELPASRVLLVCGADHVCTFSKMLQTVGAQCEVLDAYWLANGDFPTGGEGARQPHACVRMQPRRNP
jgi:hypothetical protein